MARGGERRLGWIPVAFDLVDARLRPSDARAP